MKLFSTIRAVWLLPVCAALMSCASSESEPAGVVRGRAPQGYDKTIASYFAFKVRAPKNNVEISVDKPEPSDCPLDGYITSARGWVVPVVYATRTGAITGKETIYINAKQYYFWFNGDTIAGVTTRLELCPGSATSLSQVTQAFAAAEGSPTPRSSLLTGIEGSSPAGAAAAGQLTGNGAQDTRTVSGRPHRGKTLATKKAGPSSGSVRHAVKTGGPHEKGVRTRAKVDAVVKRQQSRAGRT
jgi:hypothetical protein